MQHNQYHCDHINYLNFLNLSHAIHIANFFYLSGCFSTDNCNDLYLIHHLLNIDPMAIELDRNGVPVYDGALETFDEWKDRSWDLFWARSGNDPLQIATPRSLRAGIRDSAYDAVRGLAHDKLRTIKNDKATEEGMQLVIETVRRLSRRRFP